MNEAELRELLRKASNLEQPSDRFISSLWDELESRTHDREDAPGGLHHVANVTLDAAHRPEIDQTGTEPERVKSGPMVALAAGAAVLVIGLLAVLLAPISGPEPIVSGRTASEPTGQAPLAAVDDIQAERNDSAIVKTCDRLLVETRVAAVLRPGVVAEATSYRPSGSVATDVSTIELRSLVQVMEQLSDADGIRSDIRVRHALTSATGALDQAILLIEMGEPTLAHDSIHQARVALGELASESALGACLETVS